MAKQTINVGTSANKGDGDPLRTAFGKINDNFDEVYGLIGATGGDTDDVIAPMLVHDQHTNVTVTRDDDANLIIFSVDQVVTDLKGTIFGDDSTMLVDGVNSTINLDGTVKGNIIPDTDVTYDIGSATKRFRDLYLSGSTIDLGGTTLSVVGGQLQIDGTDIADVVVANAKTDSLTTSSGNNVLTVSDTDASGLVVIRGGNTVTNIALAGKTAQGAATVESGIHTDGTSYSSLYTGALGFGLAAYDTANGIITTDGESLTIGSGNNAVIFLNPNGGNQGLVRIAGTTIDIVGAVDFTNATVTGLSTKTDLVGSVFADDSTLMVDAVNNKLYAETLTTLAVFGNPTLALNADVIALDAQSGNLTLQTTNRIINNFGSAWEVQGTAASMVLNDDGVLPSELSVNIDVVDFGTGNTVDLQGNSVLFDGASIQNFAPGNIYANSGQFLYVTSKHSGGTATNVVFTYDTNINNPRQTFYGKTQFGFNGAAPIVDFDGTTIQNWTDPNVVNTHGGGAIIVVGGQTATMDNLTVRITENTPGELDVEFNYDPSSGTVAVSANGDVANRFNGTTNFTAGNTTWTTMNILTIVGDKGEFTIADHSFHKIYRVTTFARALPGGVDAGDAYCVIERLK